MESIGTAVLDPSGSSLDTHLIGVVNPSSAAVEDESTTDNLAEGGPGALAITDDQGQVLMTGTEGAAIVMGGEEGSGGLLSVVEDHTCKKDGTTETHVSTEQEVIGLLLAQGGNESDSERGKAENPASGLQAVTLPDGTTAYIQQGFIDDNKLLEGQAIQLEDGTTAVVQMYTKRESQSTGVMPVAASGDVATTTASDIAGTSTKFVDGQAVQLEDGSTAYLHSTPKEGFQAVQLDDGSTAYIAPACAENMFGDNQFDPNALNLLGSQFEDNSEGSKSSTTANSGEIICTNVNVMKVSDKASAMGDRAFRCSYEGCGRLYTTQHHLKVHERSHTGDRPFRCEFLGCGKAFATGYGLKSHTRVHTGEKPYSCPEESCNKAFKTSGDLQKHVRTHTGEKPFKCPFEGCERSFTTSNIRKVHIRTHTGERPYICDAEGCKKSFASATNYKNHIRIHTGEKPYVCTIQGCGKRFTEYSSLYKHHVVHTHSKPYTCNHCGKTYRQTSTLAMHKRTAHGDDSMDEDPSLLPPDETLIMEPVDKRQKMDQVVCDFQGQDDGEGTLVINTSDVPQVHNLSMAGESVSVVTQDGMVSLGGPQQISIQHLPQLVASGDQQHIYLVTDPVQLQALQQIAQTHTASTADNTTTGTVTVQNIAVSSEILDESSIDADTDSVGMQTDSGMISLTG